MKKIKSILAVVMVICMMCCLFAACGENAVAVPTEKASEAATKKPVYTFAPDDDEPTEAPEEGKVKYTVKVVDAEGNPVAGAVVQICKLGDDGSCYPRSTGSDGVATYDVVETEYKISFISVPAGFEKPTDDFYYEAGAKDITLTVSKTAA